MVMFPVADVALPPHLVRPAELVRIEQMRGSKSAQEELGLDGGNGVRINAIRQEALRVGAQSGLAHRYSMITEYLDKQQSRLNVVFSFAGLVKDGRLLFPAIVESPNQFVMDSEKGEARVVRAAYTIESEARIISVVPTWRDYLWQRYEQPEMPHRSLLPRTDIEVAVWENTVKEGWAAGVSQGDRVYQDRLAALTKDVEGRHLYKTLEAQEVFSPAALRVEANRVTFNGRTMNVGEVIYSIDRPVNYTNAEGWKPIWTR